MKLKFVTGGFTCLFLSLFLFSCQKGEEIEYKTIDGVKVVFNPKEPAPPKDIPSKFTLEEELSIGESEGREEYMFSQIRSVAVDDEERVYVLDYKESHIKIFDKNGEYIKTFGKKGQGPGELNLPLTMFISTQNEIIVEDLRNRRFTFYSLDGKFIKNLSTAKMFMLTSNVDSKGNIIGLVIVREEENSRYELKKFDSDLEYLCSFGTSRLPSSSSTFNPFMPIMRWAITKRDHIVFGYPEKYEIKILNPQGKEVMKIVKEYDPVEITDEEKKETEKGIPPSMKLEFPQYHSAYRWLVVDNEDRIFILTWERTEDEEGYFYDVFDSEGRYIAKIPLKIRPVVWKKSKLYTIEEDDEGFQVVKRYKVMWEK